MKRTWFSRFLSLLLSFVMLLELLPANALATDVGENPDHTELFSQLGKEFCVIWVFPHICG